MPAMNFQRFLVPAGCLVLAAWAYGVSGWHGILLVAGGLVMWLLMQYTRVMAVLRRANNRPVGTVASAVMLNAKLKKGAALLHVVALTKSLGTLRTPEGAEPEVYRWTDNTDSFVDATFVHGKLDAWRLTRPPAADAALGGTIPAHGAPAPAPDAPSP
jgi:hypothetical protein